MVSMEKDEEKLFEDAKVIALAEANDIDALLADLKQAMDALGSAYNRLSPQIRPTFCVAQGRVETAIETVEAAFNLIKSLEP
jgi:hypothetical protein